MKVKKVFIGIISCCLLFLCSCASTGQKFTEPPANRLEFGKLTPADAVALLGKPRLTSTKITSDGSFEIYKYVYSHADISAFSTRVLLLEFKNDNLNGYYYWSSFDADKTRLNLQNLGTLKAGMGKLTRDEVTALMGKPESKALCPTVISDFKDACPKNTEVWGWYTADNINLWALTPQKFKSAELSVSFDSGGKVSSVDLSDSNDQDK